MKAFRSPLLVWRFTLTGLNLERFLNTLQREEVPLVSLRRKDPRTLEGVCYAADLAFLKNLAREKGWRIGEETPLRLSGVFFWLRSRPGVWIGGLLAITLMIASLQFIWSVELVGAGPYQADLQLYLAKEGLAPGVLKSRVDAAALERKLTRRYPDVAWFHVYAYNVTLVVDCVLGSPMPRLPAALPGDLVASRDGVVYSVEVFAGTAAVKAGDLVRKGQTLIYGWERGRDEQQVQVAARGVVTARCWRSHQVRVSLRKILSRETGNAASQTLLRTPWFTWPVQTQTPDFLAYNTYIQSLPLGGVFFPVALERVEWREVAMEYAPLAMEQARKEAEKAAESRLKTALRGDQIIDKWADYCMIEDDTLAVTVTMEWRMDIAQTAT